MTEFNKLQQKVEMGEACEWSLYTGYKQKVKNHMRPSRMAGCFSNDEGSVTLFALLMTMTLVTVFAAMVSYGSKQMRHAEMLRTLELAGQSILHTYDRRLLETYSLLAVDLEFLHPAAYLTTSSGPNLRWKQPGRVWSFEPSRTLDQPKYFLEAVHQAVAAGVADEVLKQFSEKLDAAPESSAEHEALFESGARFDAHISDAEDGGSVDTDGKVTEKANEATMEEQALADQAVKWIRSVGKKNAHGENQVPQDPGEDQDQDQDPDPDKDQNQDRTLEPKMKSSLISRTYKGPRTGLSPEDRISFLFYATHHFRNYVADYRSPFYKSSPESAFFKSELEYILFGHDNEAINKARAFADIYLMRLAGNVAHVWSCGEKQNIITTVAGAVNAVAGVPVPITSLAVSLTWGIAESRSDLKRLLNGESLPWVHISDEAWRTRFGADGDEAAPEGEETMTGAGLTMANYGDHLAALLAAKANTTNVLHVMDLIAIGDGAHGIDLSQRATWFAIRVEASGGLPEVVWEDGYGSD